MTQYTFNPVRPVDSSDFDTSRRGMAQAGNSFNTGIEALKDVIRNQQGIQKQNYQQGIVNNDAAIKANINKMASLGALRDAEPNMEGLAEAQYGKQFTPGSVKDFVDARKSILKSAAMNASLPVAESAGNKGLSNVDALQAYRTELAKREMLPEDINQAMAGYEQSHTADASMFQKQKDDNVNTWLDKTDTPTKSPDIETAIQLARESGVKLNEDMFRERLANELIGVRADAGEGREEGKYESDLRTAASNIRTNEAQIRSAAASAAASNASTQRNQLETAEFKKRIGQSEAAQAQYTKAISLIGEDGNSTRAFNETSKNPNLTPEQKLNLALMYDKHVEGASKLSPVDTALYTDMSANLGAAHKDHYDEQARLLKNKQNAYDRSIGYSPVVESTLKKMHESGMGVVEFNSQDPNKVGFFADMVDGKAGNKEGSLVLDKLFKDIKSLPVFKGKPAEAEKMLMIGIENSYAKNQTIFGDKSIDPVALSTEVYKAIDAFAKSDGERTDIENMSAELLKDNIRSKKTIDDFGRTFKMKTSQKNLTGREFDYDALLNEHMPTIKTQSTVPKPKGTDMGNFTPADVVATEEAVKRNMAKVKDERGLAGKLVDKKLTDPSTIKMVEKLKSFLQQ